MDRRGPGRPPRQLPDTLAADYLERKLSMGKLARRYGCARGTIASRLHQLGVAVRSPAQNGWLRAHEGRQP